MRVTAIFAAFSCFFLSLATVQAGDVPVAGRNVESKAVPGDDAQPQGNSGTLTLSGSATYQGTTTVSAGTLQLGGAGTATTTALSIDANGTRESQNEEYGQKVKITDDPQNGIKIVQTTHKGGTDETKTFEAKDATELEKKSPAAFKIYQKYLGNQGQANVGVAQAFAAPAGQIQIIGGGQIQLGPAIPLQAMPAPFPMPGFGGPGGPAIANVQVIQAQANLAPAGPQGMSIEVVTMIMGQLSGEIESAAKNKTWKDASKDDKSAIKKKADELKKQLDELEKQFEEK